MATEYSRCPKCGRELRETVELGASEVIHWQCGWCQKGY